MKRPRPGLKNTHIGRKFKRIVYFLLQWSHLRGQCSRNGGCYVDSFKFHFFEIYKAIHSCLFLKKGWQKILEILLYFLHLAEKMSKMGAKTYSRKPECRPTPSLAFDQLLAEKGNKPSTAKVSVSAVHRWGMTSYTSIRKTHLNGEKNSLSETVEPAKRIKTEPKISSSHLDDPFGFETDIHKSALTLSSEQIKDFKGGDDLEGKPVSRPNKFFKSGARGKSSVLGTNSPKKNDFDALRLSVSHNWNNLTQADNVNVPSHKKLTYLPVIGNSPLAFQSAISLEPVSTTYSDSTLTTYISSFTESSHEVMEDYPMQLSDQTSLTNDYLHSNCLPVKSTLKADLETNNHPGYAQKEYSLSSNNVISDFCRTYGENRDFDLLSKCDTASETNPIAMSTTVQILSDRPSEKLSCDSSASVEEPCPPSSTPFPYIEVLKKSFSTEELKQNESVPENSQPSTEELKVKIKSYSRPKKIFNTSKKLKAVYNPRHWQSINKDDGDGEQDEGKIPEKKSTSSLSAEFDAEIENDTKPQNSHVREIKPQLCSEPSNSIKCFRPMKELYTVVRNVKQAYQCHESGETQEFNDDIEYLLEGLQVCNGIGTRCLSVLGLSTKCMGPAFRIHLRAHGTMPRIFSALQDAPSDPNLSLCTATLLFVLSQDRLTMDIEASTLSLMLQLLETDPDIGSPEKELDLMLEDPALCAMQEKHREKVHQLCEQIQQKGHAKHLKLDNINTGILAMETLLSLTSRKAGEWFKEEIRILHGLDHIVDTISSCVELLLQDETQFVSQPSESQIDKIRKIDRCLRVLENVTYLNHENQDYLLKYKSALVITYCLSLMKLCKSHLLENQQTDSDPPSEDNNITNKTVSPVVYCLLSVMKVLLNITYENPMGSSDVGSQTNSIENVLLCVLQVPRAVSREKRFDLLVLSLGLMINLVEHNSESRKQLMELYVSGSFDSINDGYEILACEALIEVLLSRLESARESEEQADELLSSQAVKRATDKKDVENAVSNAECIEETLMKTLQTAGKHMEHSIIAAYISLILGLIIENNQEYADALKDLVPDGTFDEMVEVLKKFMSFVSLTGVIGGNTGVKSIQRIMEVLSSS